MIAMIVIGCGTDALHYHDQLTPQKRFGAAAEGTGSLEAITGIGTVDCRLGLPAKETFEAAARDSGPKPMVFLRKFDCS